METNVIVEKRRLVHKQNERYCFKLFDSIPHGAGESMFISSVAISSLITR